MDPFAFVFHARRGDVGAVALAAHPEVPADRDAIVMVLLVGAFYVYAWQRTYWPGS